ncbi:MAG: mechanosensitive ion channel domain-containing protein [Bacteroidota bacterium]
MEVFLRDYSSELLGTIMTLSVFVVARFLLVKTIKRIGRISEINRIRTRLVIRYVTFALSIILIVALVLIWGVNIRELGLIISSVFAVIGVALFANWSILSNITAGIILFLYFPYKIGDRIRVQDKDFPDEAIIMDIQSFTVHLLKDNGELLTYPNNLFLQKGVVLIKKRVEK